MNDGGNKTQLGKILLKRKLVSSTDLDSLLNEQQTHPDDERLASKILKRGLSDEVKLLMALSEQMGVPALNLDAIYFLCLAKRRNWLSRLAHFIRMEGYSLRTTERHP